jgi:hypothetical protein
MKDKNTILKRLLPALAGALMLIAAGEARAQVVLFGS